MPKKGAGSMCRATIPNLFSPDLQAKEQVNKAKREAFDAAEKKKK
jgi:hypothetical protein